MNCIKCGKEGNFTRDFNVSLKVLESKTTMKKSLSGENIYTTTKTHQVQKFSFGFCNHCVRLKYFFSSDFFWAFFVLLFGGFITFIGLYFGVKKDQEVAWILSSILMVSIAIGLTIIFLRKVFKPYRIDNKHIANWFINDILAYCKKTYGVDAGSVLY